MSGSRLEFSPEELVCRSIRRRDRCYRLSFEANIKAETSVPRQVPSTNVPQKARSIHDISYLLSAGPWEFRIALSPRRSRGHRRSDDLAWEMPYSLLFISECRREKLSWGRSCLAETRNLLSVHDSQASYRPPQVYRRLDGSEQAALRHRVASFVHRAGICRLSGRNVPRFPERGQVIG